MNIVQFLIIAGIVILSGSFGCIIGILITKNNDCKNVRGVIRLAYDEDDPGHPAMGLMLENLEYIMSHEFITLKVEKKNFPKTIA